jgi:hypothetical protein
MQKNADSPDRPDDRTGKHHGPQGIDKAPGEETATDLDNEVANTQKGKNKVDGDPSKKSDRPGASL